MKKLFNELLKKYEDTAKSLVYEKFVDLDIELKEVDLEIEEYKIRFDLELSFLQPQNATV